MPIIDTRNSGYLTTIAASSITNATINTYNSGILTFPSSHNPVMVVSNAESSLSVKGTFDLNGVDVGSALTDIMETLNVIKRDLDMEKRYPKLKEAYDHYHKILDDYKLIDMMKGEQ